jgi:hypothetical protein
LTFDGANLGVGAAPTGFGKLDVRNGTNFRVLINGIAGYGSNAIAGINDVGSETHLGLAGTPIAFYVQAAEQMRLTSTGLGIGTSSPGAKLHTVGASGAFLENTAGGFFQQIGFRSGVATFAYYDSLEFGYALAQGFSSYTATMRLTSAGNLGIGTSSPGHKLTVHGGINVTSSATLPAGQGSMLFSYEAPVNRIYMGDGTGYSFAFSKRVSSTTTDLVTLTDAGNLGIGTTSPARKIDIANGQIRISNSGAINPSFGTRGSGSGASGFEIGQFYNEQTFFIYDNAASLNRFSIKPAGQARFFPLSADPAGAENGDVYYNSTTNKLRVYAGGSWVDLH